MRFRGLGKLGELGELGKLGKPGKLGTNDKGRMTKDVACFSRSEYDKRPMTNIPFPPRIIRIRSSLNLVIIEDL